MTTSETPRPVYVLHEYGAPSHFRAMSYLEHEGHISELVLLEYSLVKQAIKALIYRESRWLDRALKNARSIWSLLSTQDKTIVISGAPYDPLIPLFHRLKDVHRTIYFSSWPYWDGTSAVKKSLLPQQKRGWERFLSGIEAVAVTRTACRGLERLGAKACHIPHAVDTDLFHPDEGHHERSSTRVLYVGQQEHRKGVDLLIDIFSEHYRHRSDVEFWFVGKGPYQSRVRVLGRRHPNLRYWGYVSDKLELARIYRLADVFVLPSRRTDRWEELFGIVLIEAMASGLPVIATDCVGPLEIVRDEVFGLIVQEGENTGLFRSLNRLISSSEVRREMGAAARREAVVHYDVRVLAEKWKEVIERST